MESYNNGLSSLLFTVIFCLPFLSQAKDTLKPGDTLQDTETLVSAGGIFELGFFGSRGSTNTYLGIWFKNDKYKKPIWVANRDNPFSSDSSSLVFTLNSDGNMEIRDHADKSASIVVNSGSSFPTSCNNTRRARILDTGNLVLSEGETENYNIIWESFHYPIDAFLPGMKLGFFNIGTEQPRRQLLVSWSSPFVPTSGPFSLGLDSEDMTFLKLSRTNGAQQSIGFWDGQKFKFLFKGSTHYNYNFSFVMNSREIYLTYDNGGRGLLSSWFELASDGEINEFRMVDSEVSLVNHTLCKNTTMPESNDECIVVTSPGCKDGDEFLESRGSLPLSSMLVDWSDRMSSDECEVMCKTNCSCAAYASFHDDGTGCQLYYGLRGDLVFMLGEGNTTIYVRGGTIKPDQQKQKKLPLVVILPVVSTVIFLLIVLLCLYRWRKSVHLGFSKSQQGITDIMGHLPLQSSSDDNAGSSDVVDESERKTDEELPLLRFSCIIDATDNFSTQNKLGEGGFGPVYKGKLLGQEVAVKRLSRNSGQGIEEFKTEVHLISKLQHRNLVKLVGYCIEREEKILVYEYMPNKSLDSFIFDPKNRSRLDWRQRLRIVEGIIQGLLYLHKYSRLRIIHRDLKTSNILLDNNLEPKISDFGMARIFSENESQAKTKRIVGTYGYMSPEYAVLGIFSTKSDVFSFGVILLEIISGRKNATFSLPNCSLNLLGYAWELWKSGRSIELMDAAMCDDDSCPATASMFMQIMQVGLLCIQENAEDRPSMSHVVSMLYSEGAILPTPRPPAFSTHLKVMDVVDLWPFYGEIPSQNEMTFSDIEAR